MNKKDVQKGSILKCYHCRGRVFKTIKKIMHCERISPHNIICIPGPNLVTPELKNGQIMNCPWCKQEQPSIWVCDPKNWSEVPPP